MLLNKSRLKTSMCLKVALMVMLSPPGSTSAKPEGFVLDRFLGQSAGLNQTDIASVHSGKAIAVVLDSAAPEEVSVAGIVHIDAAPEDYLKLATNFDELRKLPGYLGVHRFSNPPLALDLAEFTIDPADIKDLKTCKPDDCDVQLPSEAMEQFQKSIKWSGSDAAKQANSIARQMALDSLLAYQKGGNAALGVYRDKEHPTMIAETFQTLLSRVKPLPVYLPELNRYLLEYPDAQLKNSTSDFYWEKVNFGLKPTLRIVHQIVYRGGSPADPIYGVALKQLYASHYFKSALDLTICLRDSTRPNERGFYLLTVKGSQQAGLTGLKGSIVRKVAVGKSRSALEKTLTAIKQKVEIGVR
jgi:hypothetical protein